MFSSNDLSHFVFANDDDTYYCGGLLRLNLNQYLWLKLHEAGYQTVFFLHAGQTTQKTFSIQTYGAKDGSHVAHKGFFQNVEKKLRKWLSKQMEENAAFVCPIRDFCAILSSETWRGTLTSLVGLKGRNGIFVLTAPVTAEDSQELLLKSCVFDGDHLSETAVIAARNGGVRALYPAIQKRKGESMVFLNTFCRKEMVEDLLLRLAFDENRPLAPEDRTAAAEYLICYLNCPDLRKKEPLFSGGGLDWNFKYRDLYDSLRSEQNWERLLHQSRLAQKNGILQNRLMKMKESPGILRKKDSYVEQCLRLAVPKEFQDGKAESLSTMIQEIQRTVREPPKNRLESPSMVKEIELLLLELESVQADGYVDTYERVLYALQFCIQWVCVQPDSESEEGILQIAEKLRAVIQLSREYERQRIALTDAVRFQTGLGSLAGKTIEQAVNKVAEMEQILYRYEDAVKASVVKLNQDIGRDHISESVQRLEEEERRRKIEQVGMDTVNWDDLRNIRPPE